MDTPVHRLRRTVTQTAEEGRLKNEETTRSAHTLVADRAADDLIAQFGKETARRIAQQVLEKTSDQAAPS